MEEREEETVRQPGSKQLRRFSPEDGTRQQAFKKKKKTTKVKPFQQEAGCVCVCL